MNKRRIAVVTGSRAEYGLLYWLLKELKKSKGIDLRLVVTGMHLSREFGLTYKVIERDGFKIDRKVKMLTSLNTAQGAVQSCALGVAGLGRAFAELKPDMVVLTGDRFEMLAAATAAMLLRIPIAHIGGGEITLGAIDEAIRHAISKMSHVHFCSNEQAKRVLIQMGEEPKRVFCFGSIGMDDMLWTKLLTREQLCRQLGLDPDRGIAVVTYHPETLKKGSTRTIFSSLLKSLDAYTGNIVLTGTNADPEGKTIHELIKGFIQRNPRAKFFVNLGRFNYLSLMKHAQVMVGNSSSGLCEAPTFELPVVNVGDRQKGRLCTKNVIDVKTTERDITRGIQKAVSKEFRRSLKGLKNPYYKGLVSPKILKILSRIDISQKFLKKGFVRL